MTNKGFTLVELIIVISIVTILATLGVSSYANVQKSARDAKRKADLNEIKKAIVEFHVENDAYPDGTATGAMCGTDCGTSNTNPTDWIVGLVPVYADDLPIDPLNNATYTYMYDRLPVGFRLTALLEKTGVPYIITTQ